MIVTQNARSQLTLLQQGGAEQLLVLLKKATLPRLRISIICTLWSLTETKPTRKQTMACKINKHFIISCYCFSFKIILEFQH